MLVPALGSELLCGDCGSMVSCGGVAADESGGGVVTEGAAAESVLGGEEFAEFWISFSIWEALVRFR